MSTTVSLRDAAEKLGVHYMTVYRWVRIGQLPATKEGAEWRVRAADLASVQDTPPTPRGKANWSGRLYRRLVAGDEAGAWTVVEGALASAHDPAQIYIDVVGPAMRKVGAEWEKGKLDVSAEHRASAIAHRIVGRLGALMRKRGRHRGTVVVGSPSGERHSLPLAIVADILRASGYDVMDLGSDVPDDSFELAVTEAERLIAVGVGVSTVEAIPAAKRLVKRLRSIAPDAAFLAGGAAVESAAALNVDFHATDGVKAARFLDDIS